MNLPWSFTLPMPPGVNQMYLNRSAAGQKGRMISPVYVAWREEAQASLWTQKPLCHFKGEVAVCMAFGPPKSVAADLDGKIKPVLDFCVRHELIEEDSFKFVRLILASWNDETKGCKVTITNMAGAA
jgi:Holliday junction resolvase RusA-like endonuclease